MVDSCSWPAGYLVLLFEAEDDVRSEAIKKDFAQARITLPKFTAQFSAAKVLLEENCYKNNNFKSRC